MSEREAPSSHGGLRVSEPLEKKKGSVRQAGLFASISCPEGAGVAPAAQAGGAVWVCAGA